MPEILDHDAAIDALCGCAATVTTLSYQEAIEGYFALRGLPHPAAIQSLSRTEELVKGKAELLGLMDSIWRAEYRLTAPQWQPLDVLPGMVSQIDNMYAGVRGQRDKARWNAVADMRVPQTAAEAGLQIHVTIGPALEAAQAALASHRGEGG